MPHTSVCGITPAFAGLSPIPWSVRYVFLTRLPCFTRPKTPVASDLHVLGTPPAFVLSQDQTLHLSCHSFAARQSSDAPALLCVGSSLSVYRCQRTCATMTLVSGRHQQGRSVPPRFFCQVFFCVFTFFSSARRIHPLSARCRRHPIQRPLAARRPRLACSLLATTAIFVKLFFATPRFFSRRASPPRARRPVPRQRGSSSSPPALLSSCFFKNFMRRRILTCVFPL